MLPYRENAFAWNAVEVLVNGLLQHGHVINVVEGGLIIDFGCATQRSEFVAYGPIILSHHETREKQDVVQALWRQRADAAWIWYPGKAIDWNEFYYGEAEYVEVELPHGTVTELVPWQQVRPVLTDEDYEERRVKPNDFVIRSCPLPADYWQDATALLAGILKYELSWRFKVLLTVVLSQRLLYLQWQYASPLTSEQLQERCDVAKKKQAHGCPSDLLRWIHRHGPLDTASRKRKISNERRASLPLAAELLQQVFQALDSIGRIRCRRVCHAWDRLLFTDTYFPDVRVTGGEAAYGDVDFSEDGVYWVLACLFKCLTSATTMVVVSNLKSCDCWHVAGPINRVFSAQHKIPTVVFHGCYLGEADDRMQEAIERLASLAGDCRCERMVWKKCGISYSKQHITVTQQAFNIRSQEDTEMQLWEHLEGNLEVEEPLDLQAVSAWITDCWAQQRHDEIEEVVKVLNQIQSVDPRPISQYRGVEWTVSNVSDLDVSKLTSLTARLLVQCMRLAAVWRAKDKDPDSW
ncbi:uncharacterized protein LOC129600241 [Paramacrobiotus metropolitanus]|uniref:uncharacterized protein LOC129600241 n=1 Tax=Paramacrobiotus metropolitanus TaxID=2943436 RepID=UPI002445A58D|nr:uncharacterized protein LOC129600241 [Paramacrobiotus metropolitanus]